MRNLNMFKCKRAYAQPWQTEGSEVKLTLCSRLWILWAGWNHVGMCCQGLSTRMQVAVFAVGFSSSTASEGVFIALARDDIQHQTAGCLDFSSGVVKVSGSC